jgi:uncharacterized membrane protein
VVFSVFHSISFRVAHTNQANVIPETRTNFDIYVFINLILLNKDTHIMICPKQERQTISHKTRHRKMKIRQHELYQNRGQLMCSEVYAIHVQLVVTVVFR